MNRRNHIKGLGLMAAHGLFPSILTGFVQRAITGISSYQPLFFTGDELNVLAGVIDIILPATKSRAASEVLTHEFIDEVFARCLTPENQALVRTGFDALMQDWQVKADREGYIRELDAKAFSGTGEEWFRWVKQYALVGFFTSHEGMTVASNYLKVPGDFIGEVPSDDSTLNQGKTDMRYYL